jgi:hypothetical protein
MCNREHLADTIAYGTQHGLAMTIHETPGHKDVSFEGHPLITAHFACNWCIDCDQTNPALFSVYDTVREEAGLPDNSICCLECLTRRVKRRLTPADFTTSRQNSLVLAGVAIGREAVLATMEPLR